MKIAIDPGHAGRDIDPGAVGKTIVESDVTLEVAYKLRAILEVVGHEPILTRTGDDLATDDLGYRCDIANDNGADLFVSIHCNAANNRAARGTETFYASAQGAKLANCIHQEMLTLNLVDRGIKPATFYVLTHTQMPAVLVEVAFISNPDEESLLTENTFLWQVAHAIARGITCYFKDN